MVEIQSILNANAKLAGEIQSRADEIDQTRTFPRQNLNELGQCGVLGLLVSPEYGGAGGTVKEMSEVLITQAAACASTAMVTLMHYCGAGVIAARGSEDLKREVLPAVAAGRHISTLAFSEPGSGSHFYAPVSEIKDQRITARKSFVTSAGEADSYVVSTRSQGAAAATESDLYLIPRGTSGLKVEGRFDGLGLRGNGSAPMTLTEVPVSDEWRLGPAGSGFGTMLDVVLPQFQIGLASVSIGIATAAFEAVTGHVAARTYQHANGAALASIPRVQYLAAEMAIELNAAAAYLKETVCKALSRHPAAMVDVLAVKARAAEAAVAITSRAMTLGGGWAFGRKGGLERSFRDAQAAAVMAPTSDVLKEFIGKSVLGLPLF